MNTFLMRTDATPTCTRALARAAAALFAFSISDMDLVHDLDLAVTEACSNVSRHAYENGEVGEVELIVRVEEDSHVEVEVVDFGTGFACSKDGIHNAPPEAEGGRGLFIIKELVDDLAVNCIEGRNTVFFRKNIRKELWNPCD